MKHAAIIVGGVVTRLAAQQTIFTAKIAKIAKGAKEEQFFRSVFSCSPFFSLALFAYLASLAVKTLRPPPVLVKANP